MWSTLCRSMLLPVERPQLSRFRAVARSQLLSRSRNSNRRRAAKKLSSQAVS